MHHGDGVQSGLVGFAGFFSGSGGGSITTALPTPLLHLFAATVDRQSRGSITAQADRCCTHPSPKAQCGTATLLPFVLAVEFVQIG